MAFSMDWGSAIKLAAPVLANMASGKAANRTEENTNAMTQARDTEAAAWNRARAEVEAGTLDLARQKEAREAQQQAFKNSQTAALMKNMQDVNFNREGFRSKVPTVRFSGGLRPSAMGAEGLATADLMQQKAMQQLNAPPPASGGGSEAVSRYGGAMPEYAPAEQKGAGFWENALGVAGLGAGVAGELFKKAPAAAAAPGAANAAASNTGQKLLGAGASVAGGAGGLIPGLFGSAAVPSNLFGGAGTGLASSAATRLPGVNMAGGAGGLAPKGLGVSFSGGAGAGTSLATQAPGAFSKGLGMANSAAGPIGMGLGIASGFLPAGKARTAADWAGKGAQIGSFLPGPGTLIGLGVGAAAGAVKGHQNATVKDREKFAKSKGYKDLYQLNQALRALGPEGERVWNEGVNKVGKHDEKGNAKWMAEVEMLLGGRR